MDLIAGFPVWLLALLIFCFRVVDVSLGTIRTLSVVQGRITLSVVLGFFEVLIWITAVSQVIAGIRESALLLLAYAGGFAAGNAAGILIESRIGLGSVVVRIISAAAGKGIAEALRGKGFRLTTFLGEGRDGPVTLIYLTCPRRELPDVIDRAREVDPQVFWAVETLREQSHGATSPHGAHSTGWRAVLKKK